jgi:hypothetical protein
MHFKVVSLVSRSSSSPGAALGADGFYLQGNRELFVNVCLGNFGL